MWNHLTVYLWKRGENRTVGIRYVNNTKLISTTLKILKIVWQKGLKLLQEMGSQINPRKCKAMTQSAENLIIDIEHIENIQSFVFLGSTIPHSRKEVYRHGCLHHKCFADCKTAYGAEKEVSKKLKIRLYCALIVSIVTYGSKTWTLREEDEKALDIFGMKCFWTLRIHWYAEIPKCANMSNFRKIENTATNCARRSTSLVWSCH